MCLSEKLKIKKKHKKIQYQETENGQKRLEIWDLHLRATFLHSTWRHFGLFGLDLDYIDTLDYLDWIWIILILWIIWICNQSCLVGLCLIECVCPATIRGVF